MAPVVGRIHRRSSFRALAKPAGRGAHGPVAVAYSQAEMEFGGPMVAYAVGRTVGTAVVRNRVRRRLRAAIRAAAPSLPSGCYLVRVTPAAADTSYGDLDLAVRSAALAAADRAGRHPSVGVPA